MDNKEQKATPTTFRITSTTNDKFKELAQSFGFTQEEMLSNLISTYELENAKALIINREKEIDEFQSHVSRLVNIYLNSLELNQNSENRIHEKYSNEINSKSEIINNLQEKLLEKDKQLSSLKTLLQDISKDYDKSSEEIKSIKDTLETKENLIIEYKEKIDTLTSLVTEYREYKEDYLNLKSKYESSLQKNSDIQYELKELRLEKSNLEKTIEIINNQLQEYKDNINQIKLEHKESIAEKNNEINKMQKDFEEHLLKENEKLKLHLQEEKEVLEKTYINNLEKSKLEFDKILFEKDKEIVKLKTKKTTKTTSK